MRTEERIRIIRLSNKLSSNPDFANKIGISIQLNNSKPPLSAKSDTKADKTISRC